MVRVVVKDRTDSKKFDAFIKSLEGSKPIDLQIIEDPLNLKFIETSTTIEVTDTPQLLIQYIQDLPDSNVDKKKLEAEILELYREAQLSE